MKTNLDHLFKTSETQESEGIWLEIAEGVAFKTKRFGGFNSTGVKAVLAKHYKPHAKLIESGTLSEKKESEILTRVFVESCVVDWKGIEIDGELKPFSKDLCVSFLVELPELTKVLMEYAQNKDNYKEVLGNF